ncbi:MAG: hypothetical protein JRJ29_11145 [Deltaproteobacteria bacterium]|nr:hypothetical protein [Deltaproteobacteria bacterium]
MQATVFTPSFVFSTSKILKELMELTPDMLEGEPTILPLPDDAPHEIPRMILESKEKRYKLEVAPARINFFRNKIKKEDRVELREFVQKAGEVLISLLDGINANCGRIAAVINRYSYQDNPSRKIALHFCKDSFTNEPFDRPSEFELHCLRKYDFMGSFKVNSWVRIRSGRIRSESGLFRSVVFAHQDINTLAEETKTYNNKEILSFYNGVCDEFDKILKLYFPE